ncbi:MAG: hypothetical protein ABIT01_07085 [Thermoanaerobaculia bacterium]
MSGFDPLGWLLGKEQRRAYERARAAELPKLVPAKGPDALLEKARRRVDGPNAFTFGTLPSGARVDVSADIALMSALVIGASGSGKTRFLLGLILELLRRLFSSPAVDVELEIVDPKAETVLLVQQAVAAMYLRADARLRERIRRRVQVIEWSRGAVSPFAPFDNADGLVSNAYLAYLRTDVTVQASPSSYSEPLRQALFMLSWLLTEKRFPPNVRFVSRLFSDAAFRARVVADVAEPDLRAYFLELERTLARPTADALLRRLQTDLAFPELRLSIGIPPADLGTVLPKQDPRVVLGNYGSAMALPPSKGFERAAHRVTDVLLRAPRRDPKRPGLLILEEAPTLLSGSSELVEPLSTGARTLRSVGLGIIFCGQDVANALPSPMVRTLQLNTRWLALFRSHEEASWIYPHVVADEALASLGEGERQKEFRRHVESLARQRYYLLVKGEPALPVIAPTIPDIPTLCGISEAELLDVFRREVASRSMVPAKVAADLIARWEADVVDRAAVPPTPLKPKAAPPAAGIADLLARLAAPKKGA